MQTCEAFINKICAEFLEVGSYDYDELREMGAHPASNVSIELDALVCLQFFSNIKNLILKSGAIDEDGLIYLKNLQIESLKLDYYSDRVDNYTIDLSLFPSLQYVFSRTQFNFCNAHKCASLRTLIVQEWYDKDFSVLKASNLQALSVFSGKLRSLDGLQDLPELCSLSLANQRNLQEIHSLEYCTNLESLSLESCNRIDVSQIPILQSLRYLKIISNKKAENLDFLRKFYNIEHVIIDLYVEDGKLDVLREYEHSVILTDCRHYNAQNKDLPKAKKKFCSAIIPEWMEILPES